MDTRTSEFFSGVRAILPLLIGAAPFGLIYGATAINTHLGPIAAQGMSGIVFAGSSQFLMVQLIGAGTPALIIIFTAAVVNLRHMLYSASLATHFQDVRPYWWRWVLAYLLTDEAYAATVMRFRSYDSSQFRHWFFFGAGFTLWCTWQLSTAIGIFVGTSIPASWDLDFTLPLTFIAIIVPALRKQSHVIVSLIAGVLAIVTINLPLKLGLLVSACIAIIIGMLWPVSALGSRDEDRMSTINEKGTST